MLVKEDPNKKWSNLRVAEKADWEGLDYLIQNYLRSEMIEDPVLAALWDEAQTVLGKITAILDKAVADAGPSDGW